MVFASSGRHVPAPAGKTSDINQRQAGSKRELDFSRHLLLATQLNLTTYVSGHAVSGVDVPHQEGSVRFSIASGLRRVLYLQPKGWFGLRFLRGGVDCGCTRVH